MSDIAEEQKHKLRRAQKILEYEFQDPAILLAAITHPSATEGKPVKFSYERLEFLGDSILGAIVANEAFHAYPELDEGGRAVKDTVKVMPAQLKEAVDAGRSRYLAERAEHARQASRAAEHEAPRAQRSVER